MEPPKPGFFGRLLGKLPDPIRNWPESDEPLPPFDLAAGSLGGLRFGDEFDRAEFLGRPDRVEHPGGMWFHYDSRGFQLYFEAGQFVELSCDISKPANRDAPSGQGYSRPTISGGLTLTPETTEAQVRNRFGPPDTDEEHTLVYPRGRYYMTFEFDPPTGKLLTWSACVDD
jgi:hypothetical protein